MWVGRLRNNYGSFEEFKAYSNTYKLAARLGYTSGAAAWRANPIVTAGVNAGDFRKVRPCRLKDEIVRYMARAFFASAWADQCEEYGHGMMLSGKEITEIMPQRFDPAAWHAARTLWMDMERENGKTLPELYLSVCRKVSPEEFGHYAAMGAMGHGVSLSDYDIEDDEVKTPYVEFSFCSLERDYFEDISGQEDGSRG